MKLTLRPNLRSQCPFEGSNFFFRSTAHAAQCTDRRTALFPAAVSSHEPPHSVRSSPSRHRYDVQACSTLQAEPNASHPTAEAPTARCQPACPTGVDAQNRSALAAAAKLAALVAAKPQQHVPGPPASRRQAADEAADRSAHPGLICQSQSRIAAEAVSIRWHAQCAYGGMVKTEGVSLVDSPRVHTGLTTFDSSFCSASASRLAFVRTLCAQCPCRLRTAYRLRMPLRWAHTRPCGACAHLVAGAVR